MSDCLILWADQAWPKRSGDPKITLYEQGYQKPLGPWVIASSVRSLGLSVDVVNHTGMDWDQLWARVEPSLDQSTLWVGVSTTFNISGCFGLAGLRSQWRDVVTFMARVRSRSPRCQFIAGGYFALTLRRFNWWIFSGHGDQSIVAFTQQLRSGLLISGEDRVVKGDQNQTFLTTPTVWDPRVDRVRQGEALTVEISRGCRFKCSFCRYHLNGRAAGDYVRDPDCIREEMLTAWHQWGTEYWTLGDDTFNETTEKLLTLAKSFEKLPFRPKLTAYLRVDLLESHPEQISILRDLGIHNAMFGLETLNRQNGQIVGKGRDPQRSIDFIAELRTKHWPGVGLHSGFILGLPWDQPGTTAREFVDWAVSDRNPLHNVSLEALNIMRPAWRDHWSQFNTLSEFDRDAEKYGYLWLDSSSPNWTNSNTGMDYTTALADVEWATIELFERAKNFRIAGFTWNRLYNLGIDPQELDSCNWKTLSEKYDLVQMTQDRHRLDSSS